MNRNTPIYRRSIGFKVDAPDAVSRWRIAIAGAAKRTCVEAAERNCGIRKVNKFGGERRSAKFAPNALSSSPKRSWWMQLNKPRASAANRLALTVPDTFLKRLQTDATDREGAT